MMKKISTIIFICFVISISAQNSGVVIKKNRLGVIEYVKYPSFSSADSIPKTSKDFINDYLKPNQYNEFRELKLRQRNPAFKHEHYDQYYKGVKIMGAGYSFHFENGKMRLAHGNFVQIEDMEVVPTISKEIAKNSFAIYKQIPIDSINGYNANLIIKEIPKISGNNTTLKPFLVYRIYLKSYHPNNNEIGYIDAHNGSVLDAELNIINSSATGTFSTRYSGSKQATAEFNNNVYVLNDLTKEAIIHTWNLNGSFNLENRTELTDNDNNWTTLEHGANENDMGLDIHWGLQKMYDHLYNDYDISSFDDNGHDIEALFRYGTNYDNAHWYMEQNVMAFGDGNMLFSPLASIDIVAHEFGHGITDFQMGWSYQGDRAVFHEGLSDIWGAIMEYRISPNSVWKIAEQVTINYDCLRNIGYPHDPSAKTIMADTYLSSYYTNNDDQYIRSGVLSHWFYLLVNGGEGTNGIGNDFKVHGIGMDAAEDLLVEAIFNDYLDWVINYPSLSGQFISVSESSALFGENSFHTNQVKNAWHAVGIGNQSNIPEISGGDDVICYSGTTFTVNYAPSGSTINWTTSSNLEVKSGENTTSPTIGAVSTSSYGEGWVQVNFISNGYIAEGPRKEVVVGIPHPNITSGPDTLGLYKTGVYWSDSSGDWRFNRKTDYLFAVPRTSGVDAKYWQIESKGMEGTVWVKIEDTNNCGTGYGLKTVYIVDGGGGGEPEFMTQVKIYPNPANEFLNILFPNEIIDKIKSGKNKKYEIILYDKNQQVVFKKKSDDELISIDTKNLNNGFYYLHIKFKETLLREQIVISK